jgi:hypothetical protein
MRMTFGEWCDQQMCEPTMGKVDSYADYVLHEAFADGLLKNRQNTGWLRARTIEEVPEAVGHYALYDGMELRAAGIARNMRRGLTDSGYFGKGKFPVLLYLPDADGSTARYLDEGGFR